MTPDGPPLSKLPDGKILAFTMEVRDWIDGLLWEDEEHEPWTERNLELRYIADAAADGDPPTVHGWKLILECAEADFKETKIREFGELCREMIFTLTGEDPGEWREKYAKIVFDDVQSAFWNSSPRFKSGGSPEDRGQYIHKVSEDLFDEVDFKSAMDELAKYFVNRRRKN
jgi:hypothetical protein